MNQRVQYRERQRLTASDLNDEQDYLAGLWFAHNVTSHSPGIVRGLALHADGTVQPGVAVDGAGRYLILSAAQPVTPLPAGGAQADVWLIYCSAPILPRRHQACFETTYTRLRESARAISMAAGTGPPDTNGVFLGTIGAGGSPRYAALAGALVAHPDGRGWMQVGPRTGFDRNHFALASPDASGALKTRIIVDRDGNPTLYGNVQITTYFAQILLPAGKTQFLLAQSKIPGAAGSNIALLPQVGPASQKYTFANLLLAPSAQNSDTLASASAADIKAFNAASKLVDVSMVDAGAPAVAGVRIAEPGEDRPIALSATGGDLSFADDPAQDPEPDPLPADCGDTGEPTASDPLSKAVTFLPFATPPPGPAARRIYAISLNANGVTTQEMRADLGSAIDGDATDRFTIGASQSPFPWLFLFGDSSVGDKHDLTKISMNVKVTGSVELSPIKPNPADPDFKYLIVAAWLNGLRSSVLASHVVTVTLANLPAIIETKQPWKYDVVVANTGGNPVDIQQSLETLTIALQTFLGSLGVNGTINPGQSPDFPVAHAAGGIPAGDLTIEATISGKVEQISWWNSVQTTNTIPVVDSPEIDFSDLPDSVPANVAFQYKIGLKNAASIALTLQTAAVTESGGAGSVNVMPGQPLVAAHSAVSFTMAHAAGIPGDLNVSIALTYKWPIGDLFTRNDAAPQPIKVKDHVDINVDGGPDFTIHVKNLAAAGVQITTLQYRIGNGNLTDAPNGTGQINPGATLDTGDVPTAAPHPTSIKIVMVYQYGGRTWTLPETNYMIQP